MLIQKHQRQSRCAEQAAEQRADDRGDAEQRAHRAHVLAALLGGHDVGDDRLRQDHEPAAAEALHEPPERRWPKVSAKPAPADASRA